jgi:hypothetical protein
MAHLTVWDVQNLIPLPDLQRIKTNMETLDEFQLMDRLATHLGIAGPESQEERNTSSLYQRAVLRAAIEQIKGAHGEGLDARMKAAGMMTIAEMLESSPLSAFHVHTGVTDLASFEKWLEMKWQSYMTQQAELQLDNREDDDLFEWVVAHAAVFSTVLISFRAANSPPTEDKS